MCINIFFCYLQNRSFVMMPFHGYLLKIFNTIEFTQCSIIKPNLDVVNTKYMIASFGNRTRASTLEGLELFFKLFTNINFLFLLFYYLYI